MTLFSKSPSLTAYIKINYETDCSGSLSEKKHKDISRTIAAAKMELFVALVRSFQLLTNFIRNINIGIIKVPNSLLEYYNEF